MRQIEEGRQRRQAWEAEHPELKSLTRTEVEKRWQEFCGLPVLVCPSMAGGEPREASCLRCRDIGFVHSKGKAETGESSKYGPLIPCPDCDRPHERKAEAALKYSGIPDCHRQVNFDVFKHVVGAEEAADAAWYLATGTLKQPILWIHGINGNGKTHMAYAAALHVANQGKRVRFVVMGEFSSKVRLAIQSKGETESLWEDLKQAEFLVLDDLGAEMYGDYWESQLETLLNYRYSRRLPTIITANGSPDKFPAPIRSRMNDREVVAVIKNTAPDYRGKKRV